MKEKRLNPYQRLLSEIRQWFVDESIRYSKIMWSYPKKDLPSSAWNLYGLYERTKAAEQLGYDVILQANDNGLTVIYKKKLPHIPFEWQP